MQPNREAGGVVHDPPAPYRRVRHLVISKREGKAGSGSTYFVKTSAKQVYQFGEEEHLLCQLLDGKHSFPEIQSEFKRQIGGELTREQFDGFVTEMLECGIIEPVPNDPDAAASIEDDPKAPEEPKALVEPKPFKFDLPDEIDDLAITADDLELPGIPRDRLAVRLFDPAALLRALDWLGGPLRFYLWMLLPATLVCLVMTALRASAMGADVSSLTAVGLLAILAIACCVVFVVPALAQAAAASFLACSSRICGLDLRFRPLPGLYVSDADWGDLRGAEALRVTAAPLTARLALFVIGTAIWLATRQTGGWLAALALVIGQVALCTGMADATPFAASAGSKWLTTLFARSELWRSGGFHRAHLLALSGLWGLGCVGLALLYVCAAADVGAFGAGLSRLWPVLESMVLPLLTIVPIASWLWLRGTVKSQGVARVAYLPEDGFPSARAPARLPGIVVPLNREVAPSTGPARRRQAEQADRWPSKMLVIFATVLALCEAWGFLPYAYEAGGNFVILPHDSSKINARIQGELTEVLVNEGDRVVPGQILGILSDWDEQANLAVSKAQLENAKAALQTLYETPKPEDVELARKQYELAASKLPYDKAQYERAAVLVKTDAMSRSSYDQAVSQYQQDQAASEVARANYEDVRTGPTPAQFDAARALLRQDAATVAYNEDQLERTRIRATSSGAVVTPNPLLLRGQWFLQGALIFTVQDLSIVQADVQIPEMDIGHVQLGGVTRLRPWGFPGTTFLGQAIAIAGDAQLDPGGSGTNVLRVRTEVPNPDGALHPSMTGYAKITGYYMPVWHAFTQMVVRFFLISIWSFIP